jgi:hypothetical protein
MPDMKKVRYIEIFFEMTISFVLFAYSYMIVTFV